jgi:hypothetical protein
VDYNLSRNYQAKENIIIMGLIFPLDLSYSIFFVVFFLASFYLRLRRNQLGPAQFYYSYEAINTVCYQFLAQFFHLILPDHTASCHNHISWLYFLFTPMEGQKTEWNTKWEGRGPTKGIFSASSPTMGYAIIKYN